jgi:two-component system NtrC family sensor kinase
MIPLSVDAMELPWLSPCAASLAALARAPTRAVWSEVRGDPGCVLLLVRHTSTAPTCPDRSLLAHALAAPTALEAALSHLSSADSSFVDWNNAELIPIYQAALAYAHAAHLLADRAAGCDPDLAWIGGLLVPLGWFALAASDPDRAISQLRCQEPPRPSASRADCLAPSAAEVFQALARRLNHRWRLPCWLATVTGQLHLPLRIAQALGAEARLFQIVQLAVLLADGRRLGLGVPVGATMRELTDALRLTADDLDAVWHGVSASVPSHTQPACWEAPAGQPFLAEVLRLAVENRRLRKTDSIEPLERDLDALHRAVAEQQQGEAQRLQRLKLEALAELAGGAGHEINNPLAVISGQAQYLLGHEMDPARRRALQTIVNQANRIHQTLIDLMQFARPLPPRKQLVDIDRLLREVSLSLQGLAADRGIQLQFGEPATLFSLHGDPAQIQTALGGLVRNAIEAAPKDGWVRVHVELVEGNMLELIVEDNGRGLAAADREHLFDPFYSGRRAGRGRGLGLSVAWRLAQQHGGTVRYHRSENGPTRFVLRLPGASADPAPANPIEPALESNGVNGCHAATRMET